MRVSPSQWTRYGQTYVCGDPVVPKHDCVGLPLDASLDVGTLLDMGIEQLKDRVYTSRSWSAATADSTVLGD